MRKPSNVDPVFGRTHLAIRGKQCLVEIYPRPNYCDRGSVEVHVQIEIEHRKNPFVVDDHDMFPRYFFDLDRAKGEVDDWLEAREQKVDGAQWQVVAEDEQYMATADRMAHIMRKAGLD